MRSSRIIRYITSYSYTSEDNVARTETFPFVIIGGNTTVLLNNTGGAVPYASYILPIRAKAGTSITIASTGTFTSVVYNLEGIKRNRLKKLLNII